MIDGFFHFACRIFQGCTVFHHQHHYTGIVTLRDKSAVGFRDCRLRIFSHIECIFIHMTALQIKNLIEESTYLLFPLFTVLIQVRYRFMGIHKDET